MINKLSHINKYTALLLALVICLCPLMQCQVSASNTGEGGIDFITQVVNINSTEDFYAFAQECRSQNYSLAKTFILGADIDVSEYPELTVPYLDGVFDGQGHTISGVVIDEDISDCGLFRYVGPSGAIYDLRVEADAVFGDDQKNSGIVAGTNKGLIVRCSSAGSLNARSQVGGIAGNNEKSGVIKSCVNEASIDGKYQTGGIVGYNEGLVSDCVNKGSVNTNSRIRNSTGTGDSDTVRISIPNAVTGFAADERSNETGGVAGCSKGNLLYCENEGAVGYEELGTDTGGVAGRLSGCAVGCENSGAVKGRRNVGGIAGFLDPYKVVSLDRDYFDDIKDEFDRMDESLDDMSDSGEKFGDDLYDSFTDISDRVKDLRNVVRTYVDEYDADVRSTRRSISVQADEIEDVIDQMDYNFRLKKIVKYEKELKEDLEQIIELTEKLEKLIPTLDEDRAGALIATVRKYEEMADTLKAMIEQLEAIRKAIESGDTDGNSLSVNSIKHIPAIEPIELPEGGLPSEDERLSDQLSDLLMNYKEAAETIERIKYLYRDAFDQLDAISDVIEKWPKLFKRIKKNLRTISDDAQVIRDISDSMMDRMEYRTDAMKLDVRTRSDDITDRVDLSRDTLHDDWQRFSDDIDRVRSNFDSLRTTLQDGRDEIKKVIEDKSVYVDVSEDANMDAADGKILYCENRGEVRADAIAGGVAGCVDIEDVKDNAVDIFERYRYNEGDQEEDDEEDEEEEKDSFVHHVRALIHECKNSADVYSDDGYAGGIAGRAKYGVISKCRSFADISAGDGKYAGGVAGYSKLTVSGCYVFGGVSASSYVGGIAGSGCNISDTRSCTYMDMDQAVVKASGAIAGKATGEISGNFFVDNGFGAIDDVTKEGEAVCLSYDRLVNTFELPVEFRRFTVRFVDGDNIIWSKDFVYDDILPREDYPVLQGNEGEYVYWEDKKVSPVVRNVTVHSVRRVYVPAIASKPDREENKSFLVFEGDFYPDSLLSAFAVTQEETEKLNEAKQKIVPGTRYMISRAYGFRVDQERPLNSYVHIRALNALLPANKILVLDKDFNPVAGASGDGAEASGDAVDATTVGSYADGRALIPQEGYIILIRYVSGINMVVLILVLLIAVGIFGFSLYWLRKQRRARALFSSGTAGEAETDPDSEADLSEDDIPGDDEAPEEDDEASEEDDPEADDDGAPDDEP